MLSIFRETEQPIPHTKLNELIHEANSYFSEKVIALDEQLTGNLFSAEKIVIDHNGNITGTIIAPVCVANGTIEGNIICTGLTEIKSTAKINGNIRTSSINIETGAVINGSITMASDMEAFSNLAQKITSHAGRDFLSYNLALETVNHKDDYHPEPAPKKPVVAGQKPATLINPYAAEIPEPVVNIVAEKLAAVVNPYAADTTKPVEIVAKAPELVAPATEPVNEAPKAEQKPANEKPQENNSRWW